MKKNRAKATEIKKLEHLVNFRNNILKKFPQNSNLLKTHLGKHFNKRIKLISEKVNIKLKKDIKHSFCKKCFFNTKKLNFIKKDGKEYYPIKCIFCRKIVNKDFLNPKPKTKIRIKKIKKNYSKNILKKLKKN